MSLTNTLFIKTDLKTALLLLLHKKSERRIGGGSDYPICSALNLILEHEIGKNRFSY